VLVFRYIKFDTFTPSAERGLPVTRVVSHMTLQEIFACVGGDDALMSSFFLRGYISKATIFFS
jgi:hypothetical protein